MEESQDYKTNDKIVVNPLLKTLTQESPIGNLYTRFNVRKKRMIDALTGVKDKNAQLKKFDELENMVNQYEQILFNAHLFTDAEESHLTKLDLIYANQHFVYNDVVVSASLSKTQAIQMLCEHFTVVPLAFFLDKLISTDGYQFLELY